jgi:hypothetical protein
MRKNKHIFSRKLVDANAAIMYVSLNFMGYLKVNK